MAKDPVNFPRKTRLKICHHQKFTTFFTQKFTRRKKNVTSCSLWGQSHVTIPEESTGQGKGKGNVFRNLLLRGIQLVRELFRANLGTGKCSCNLSDPTEIPPPPPQSRDRFSNTPVAQCFLWYHRLSLLHPYFFP